MMKKVLVLMVGFLFIGVNLYAGDGDLIVNGKLGVGTPSPGFKLTVNESSNVAIYGSSTNNYGVFGLSANTAGLVGLSTNFVGVFGSSINYAGAHFSINPSSTNTVNNVMVLERQTSATADNGIGGSLDWYIEDSAGTNELSGRISNILTTATDGSETSALTFWTRTGGSAIAERVRIDGAGNVGIGTASPSEGSLPGAFNSVFHVYNSQDGPAVLRLQSSAGGLGGAITVEEKAPIRFFTNAGQERMIITGNGDVGIGTVYPTYPLHMASGAYVTPNGVWTNASSLPFYPFYPPFYPSNNYN